MIEPHIKRFPDGEAYFSTESADSTVMMRLYPEPDKRLMEAFLVGDALYPHVRGLRLIAPYLPYSRQDKRRTIEPLSFHHVLRLLAVSGYTSLITFNLHPLKEKTEAMIQAVEITNIHLEGPLREAIQQRVGDCVFVAPDEGAKYMADIHFRKHREGLGTETHVEIVGKSVEGKNVCLIDDIISAGGTMLKALDYLDKAEDIYVACVHGIFANGADERLKERGVKAIFSTNTVENPYAILDFADFLPRL